VTRAQNVPDALLPVEEAVDPAAPWIWWAGRDDVPLAGMAAPPPDFSFAMLHDERFDSIVSLVGSPGYDAYPLRAHAYELQDLYGGRRPADPGGEYREVCAAVDTIADLRGRGHGVVVHCRAGIGRTGLVVGAVLVAEGHDPDEVTAWLDRVQRARGARGWPESPWQAETLRAVADRYR